MTSYFVKLRQEPNIIQGDRVKIEKLYEAIARIGSARIQRLITQVIAKEGTFCFMKFNF